MNKLNIVFTADAWEEYLEWKKANRSMVKRIDKLISDTIRHPFSGLGKPEPLQHDLQGFICKAFGLKKLMTSIAWYTR